MRIEAGQHSTDRAFDQFHVADRFHGVVADSLECLVEQIELLVNPALTAFGLRHGGARHQQHEQRSEYNRFTHKIASPHGSLHESARTLAERSAIATAAWQK